MCTHRIVVFLGLPVLLTNWFEALIHHIDLLINIRHRYNTGSVIESIVNVRVAIILVTIRSRSGKGC